MDFYHVTTREEIEAQYFGMESDQEASECFDPTNMSPRRSVFWMDEDDVCEHSLFEKDNGIDTHGLWPCGAMICLCGERIIQTRGTDLPSIGRGDFSRRY